NPELYFLSPRDIPSSPRAHLDAARALSTRASDRTCGPEERGDVRYAPGRRCGGDADVRRIVGASRKEYAALREAAAMAGGIAGLRGRTEERAMGVVDLEAMFRDAYGEFGEGRKDEEEDGALGAGAAKRAVGGKGGLVIRAGTHVKGIPPGGSEIDCMVVGGDDGSGAKEHLCRTRNVAVRVATLMRGLNENGQKEPKYGAFEASCYLDEPWWFGSGNLTGGGGVSWLYEGIDVVDPDAFDEESRVESPLFFISRSHTSDPFLAHHDLLNTYIAYSLFNLDPGAAQNAIPVLLDNSSSTTDPLPFSTLTHLFSGANPRFVSDPSANLTAREVRNRAADAVIPNPPLNIRSLASTASTLARSNSSTDGGAVLCLRDALWSAPARGSLSALDRLGAGAGGIETTCERSALLLAFRAFVIDRVRASVLGSELALIVRAAKKAGAVRDEDGKVGDVWARLHGRVGWNRAWRLRYVVALPVPAGCEYNATAAGAKERGAASADAAELKKGKEEDVGPEGYVSITFALESNSSVDARIANEDELVAVLKKTAEKAWMGHSSRARFRAVNMSALTFEEQVAVSQGTDLFIAPHGSVLFNILYLRTEPAAGVVELKPPTRSVGNHEFKNLARKLGHRYAAVLYGSQQSGAGHDVEQNNVSLTEIAAIQSQMVQLLDDLDASRPNNSSNPAASFRFRESAELAEVMLQDRPKPNGIPA
ncbi:hypothetical protein HK101_003429, partial [Irineochytrium annulatum]